MKKKVKRKKERKRSKREINSISSDNFNPDIELYKKAHKGLIPWSYNEWNKAFEWEMKMMETPKDDWDLSPKSVKIIDEDTNEITIIKFNPLMIENQLSIYFNKTYSPELSFAHNMRYHWIQHFLHQYKSKLIDEGLMIVKEDEMLVNNAVTKALCILPYSGEVKDEYGSSTYEFSYQEVLDKSWELLKQRRDG